MNANANIHHNESMPNRADESYETIIARANQMRSEYFATLLRTLFGRIGSLLRSPLHLRRAPRHIAHG